jgi:hypothetical protein
MLHRLKSEGYRLEELVSIYFTGKNSRLTVCQGPTSAEKRAYYFAMIKILLITFYIEGHEKVLKMAAELLGGCPVTGTSYKPF